MARILNVVRRFAMYPEIIIEDISKNMLLIYLGDWRNALAFGSQTSDARWINSSLGPYSREVVSTIALVRRTYEKSHDFGNVPDLNGDDEISINHIVTRYAAMNTGELHKLAVSTFPMLYTKTNETLNLSALASIYQRDFSEARARASA
jgi:hypothetical protein